eukprot:537425-Alexandrium_andersonii.AAC.1
MVAPTTTDWAALVRLIRYLIARPRCLPFSVAGRGGRSPRVRRRGLRRAPAGPAVHLRGSAQARAARHQAL